MVGCNESTSKDVIAKLYRHFQSDVLFQNSVYLMVATAMLAGFGFAFWLIAARAFPAADVGLATTLISAMSLIALLSLVGFDTVFIRYLPRSKQKDEYVNTGMLLVFGFACVLAALFVLFVPQLAPKLAFVREHIWSALTFVALCGAAGLNALTDSYFVAQRQAKYVCVINTLFSALKIGCILLFASGGPLGIFVAAGLAQAIGLLLSVSIMIWRFGYRPRLAVSAQVIKQVRRYSFATYVSGLLNLLPPMILPLLITNRLGAEKSAYFYIVMMFANLLYTISFASARSLLAEGAHDEKDLGAHTRHALKFTLGITVPAIIAILVLGPFILSFFGENYAAGGTPLLYLMTISGLAVAVYSIYGSIFRVRHNLRIMVLVNFSFAVSVLAFAYGLIPMGLTGIGLAWLIGQTVAMLLGIFYERGLRGARASS